MGRIGVSICFLFSLLNCNGTLTHACQQNSYHPSVFLLKEGQALHIRKGILHAFRKLSTDALPSDDCHADLRAQYVQTLCKDKQVVLQETECISFAWDWVWTGNDSYGIGKQLKLALEANNEHQQVEAPSSSIVQFSILQMAKQIALPVSTDEQQQQQQQQQRTLARGFVDAYQRIIADQLKMDDFANQCRAQKNLTCFCVAIEEHQDTEDFMKNTSYECSACKCEISNFYWSCVACLDQADCDLDRADCDLDRVLFCGQCFGQGNLHSVWKGHQMRGVEIDGV